MWTCKYGATEVVVTMAVGALVVAVKVIAAVTVPAAGGRRWQGSPSHLHPSHSRSQVDEGEVGKGSGHSSLGEEGEETVTKDKSEKVVDPPSGEIRGGVTSWISGREP